MDGAWLGWLGSCPRELMRDTRPARAGGPLHANRRQLTKWLCPGKREVYQEVPSSWFSQKDLASLLAFSRARTLAFLPSSVQAPSSFLAFPSAGSRLGPRQCPRLPPSPARPAPAEPTSLTNLRLPAGRPRLRTPARAAPPKRLRGSFFAAAARLLDIRAFAALNYISHSPWAASGKNFGPRFVSSFPPKSSESGAAGTHGEEAPALWRTQGVGSRALRPVPARLCVCFGGHNEVGCTRGPEAATGAGCGTLRVTVVGGGVSAFLGEKSPEERKTLQNISKNQAQTYPRTRTDSIHISHHSRTEQAGSLCVRQPQSSEAGLPRVSTWRGWGQPPCQA
ncbi:uncharacterized protein [Vicugna pacos]|uniref:Uncharacterized protein n=1 Tax=Vicugna pacos TaxID=30538 RepID=A0A6J0B4E4_VICPA|nr:uncharacterized protein LOC107035140 [Vicugna pacos]